jgi:hypothetical protein
MNGFQLKEKLRMISFTQILSQPWDVIVMGDVSFSALPLLCRYLLLDAVCNKGTWTGEKFHRKSKLQNRGPNGNGCTKTC